MPAARPRSVRQELQGRGLLLQQSQGVDEPAMSVSITAAALATTTAASSFAAASVTVTASALASTIGDCRRDSRA